MEGVEAVAQVQVKRHLITYIVYLHVIFNLTDVKRIHCISLISGVIHFQLLIFVEGSDLSITST